MKRIIILLIICLVIGLSFTIPASASMKPIEKYQTANEYDTVVCSKCGKTLTGTTDGEQSQIAKALGLTLCMDCWLDSFYGSYRSDPLPTIAKLNGGGKIDAVYLGGSGNSSATYLRGDLTWASPTAQAAWGSITGTLSSQTDLNTALSGKEPTITAGENTQYWRGDKTWQTLPAGHTHANMSVLDATEVSFTSALKSSYDSAVSAMHSHSNKSTLDNVTEAFTTALKSTYDTCASAFTSAYKTTLDTFMSSKGQASGLAPLDANSKVPTVNLGGAGADGTKYLRGDQTWATPSSGASDVVFVATPANFAINSTTDVTIVTRDVTGVAANDQLIVEATFLIMNNSTATRVYVITTDFDAAFDVEHSTGASAFSATLWQPIMTRAVLNVRASNLSYAFFETETQLAAGIASGTDTTAAATHLRANGWGTTTSDLTGTTTVVLKVRSASATATQTLYLLSLTIRKVTPT